MHIVAQLFENALDSGSHSLELKTFSTIFE